MELKTFSSRGVQQEDVWSAADSLIADGFRPTIERVRQKIGRGSPNTVSPMLETWFATLATRLGVNKQDDGSDHVPKALQQAIKTAWEIALAKGREESAQEIVQVQDDLAQASNVLQKREAELVQMEQIRAVKRQALEETINSTRKIAEDALARLSEVQQQVYKRDAEIQNIHTKLTMAQAARDSEIRRREEVSANYLRERQTIEERAQTTQHRLLEKIDQSRQETKKISSQAQTDGKQFAEEKFLLQRRIQISEKALAIAQALYTAQSADLHSLQEAVAVSDSRSNEFQSLLTVQLDDSKKTVARLTEALLNRETGSSAKPRFLNTKFRRTRGTRKG